MEALDMDLDDGSTAGEEDGQDWNSPNGRQQYHLIYEDPYQFHKSWNSTNQNQ